MPSEPYDPTTAPAPPAAHGERGAPGPPAAPVAAPADPDPEFGIRAERVGKVVGSAVASGATAVGKGAVAVGRGLGTAYRGVRGGYQAPEGEEDFGAFPDAYVSEIVKHFRRILDHPEDARFVFGEPTRGWMNHGILRGGGVAWRGWLVDVAVHTRDRLSGEIISHRFVVRLRDGDVIDVHRDVDSKILQRVQEPRRSG